VALNGFFELDFSSLDGNRIKIGSTDAMQIIPSRAKRLESAFSLNG
jgi:hypothetical protein